MSPRIFQLAVDSVRRKDDEFNVINHGDSWVNNMMFRYDENSKPIEHIFVSITWLTRSNYPERSVSRDGGPKRHGSKDPVPRSPSSCNAVHYE